MSAALTACAYDRGRGTHVGTPASNKPEDQAKVSAWRAIASSSLVG